MKLYLYPGGKNKSDFANDNHDEFLAQRTLTTSVFFFTNQWIFTDSIHYFQCQV